MRNFKKIALVSIAILSLTALAVGGIKRFSENSILFGLGNTVRSLVFDYGNDVNAAKITVDPLSPEFVFNKKISGNELDMSGNVNVSGKLRTLGTANGSRPCPVLTLVQRDALTPEEGDCVYNSDDQTYNLYDGTQWNLIAGGGAGSLNSYYQETFEKNGQEVFSVSGVTTVANETANPLFGDRSIALTQVSGSVNDTILYDVSVPIQQGQQDSLNAVKLNFYTATASPTGIYRLKAIESDDDVTYTDVDASLDFEASSETKVVQLEFKPKSTSQFLKFKIEVITENIGEVLIIDNAEFVTNPLTSITFDNITEWAIGTPNILQGLGSITSDFFIWRRNRSNLEMMGSFITGTVTPSELQVGFPTEAGSISASSDIGGRVLVGNWGNNNASADSFLPNTVAGDTFINLGRATIGAATASSILNSSEYQSFSVSVPIEEWSATGSGVVSEGQSTPYETKTLSSSFTSLGIISELTFDNLTIGNDYDLNLALNLFRLNTTSNSKDIQFRINGVDEGYNLPYQDSPATDVFPQISFSKRVKATATSISVEILGLNNLGVSSGSDRTYFQVIPVNNPTVISPLKTEITTGQEYETGEIIDGKKVYEYVYEVPSDITTTSTILVNPVGIVDPVGHINYAGGAWGIHSVQIGSDGATVWYDISNGNIGAIILGTHKIGAGTIIRFKYTK